MRDILIAGGGPAGAAAALAARLEGAPVRLLERAASPRHKVCGEFLSPGVEPLLEALGIRSDFLALGPHRIRRGILHLGRFERRWDLPEPAWGLSRLALDRLMLSSAALAGALVERGAACREVPTIMAAGRPSLDRSHDRLFGFKSHFEGPVNDSVELFFDSHGYAGVSGIEDRMTNVCGIARESLLRRSGFDFDVLMRRSPSLARRLEPLRRIMPWVVTGPLSFAPPPAEASGPFPAGDALGFVDPFTGSGILNAIASGRMAGIAAARGVPLAQYIAATRRLLGRPFYVASLLRRLAERRELWWLAPLLPARAIFRYTRMRQPAPDFARL